jgi:hypothetical protein
MDYYEYFLTYTFWYGNVLRRWVGLALTFTMPIIMGVFGEELVSMIIDPTSNLKDWAIWKPHWPVLVVLAAWAVGYLLERYANHADLKSNELYDALTWFCQDILGTRNDKRKDIRCIILVPLGSQSRKRPIRLVQVTPYFPKTSTLFDDNGVPTGVSRTNGKPFRSFRIAKRNNNGFSPIGIIGRTAMNALSGDIPTVEKEFFDSRTDFINHMVNNWNFTEFQARKLTTDRKSYLCFPMVDKNRKELLGILCFDSCKTKAFNDNFVRLTEKHLPRFGRIITTL